MGENVSSDIIFINFIKKIPYSFCFPYEINKLTFVFAVTIEMRKKKICVYYTKNQDKNREINL